VRHWHKVCRATRGEWEWFARVGEIFARVTRAGWGKWEIYLQGVGRDICRDKGVGESGDICVGEWEWFTRGKEKGVAAQARHPAGARSATPRRSSAASAHMPELTRHHRGHGAPRRRRWLKPTVRCESRHLLSDIFVGNARGWRGDLPALRDDHQAADESQDVLFLELFFENLKMKKKGDPGARTQPEPSKKLHREAEAYPHAGSEASAGNGEIK
jgi:hypothetical protein